MYRKPLVIFLFLSTISFGQSYISSHPKNAIFALEHLRANYSTYSKVVKSSNLDFHFIMSVVMPEIANFNALSNVSETRVAEVFYVQLGDDYADFSLGHFQMKPSFIQQLESEISQNKKLSDIKYIAKYEEIDPIQIRRERLRRIQDSTWRIKYLCCFYRIVQDRFAAVKFKDDDEKIRFFATAYNHGFNCSETEIRKWMNVRYFPSAGGPGDLAYGDVALEFYLKMKNEKN